MKLPRSHEPGPVATRGVINLEVTNEDGVCQKVCQDLTALLISIGINALFLAFGAHVEPTTQPTLIWRAADFVGAPCILICNLLFPPKDSLIEVLPCAMSFIVYYTGGRKGVGNQKG